MLLLTTPLNRLVLSGLCRERNCLASSDPIIVNPKRYSPFSARLTYAQLSESDVVELRRVDL